MANDKKSTTWLSDYKYKDCRLRRHQWNGPKMFAMRESGQNFVVMRFTCLTCKMERTDVYTRMGELDHRYYKQPAGYLIHYEEGEQRLTTREVARYMIRQMRQNELPTFDE